MPGHFQRLWPILFPVSDLKTSKQQKIFSRGKKPIYSLETYSLLIGMQDALEDYKKMQDKFKLPQLQELKDTFKIEIDANEKVIDQIRLEISDRIFSFSEKIIEPIIGGAETFSCLFEQDMVTEKERERLFHIYKSVQVLKWENHMLTVRPDEKKTAEWIKKTWDLWNNELGEELGALCKKMSENWTDMKFKNEKTVYHG